MKENWEEEFDKLFKCDCFLCAEKGYPFETTNQTMKAFIKSILEKSDDPRTT